MASIRVRCDLCSEESIISQNDIYLIQYSDKGTGFCFFSCSLCRARTTRVLDRKTIILLVAHGVRLNILELEVPGDNTPPITSEDANDFDIGIRIRYGEYFDEAVDKLIADGETDL